MDKNSIIEIIKKSIFYIESQNYKSYDLYDALTCPMLDRLTKRSDLLRRITIQINAKSRLDLHWFGMKKMVHTKLVSDLLWVFSLNNSAEKATSIYKKLLDLKCSCAEPVWGLNFPYTSRFVNANANTPNIYNTVTTGLAICELLSFVKNEEYEKQIESIIDALFKVFSFKDESSKGWFSYYPGQKSPTYNVNALVIYFLCKANNTLKHHYAETSVINKLIQLLTEEQNNDGSWYYSRSEQGKWIDGFHTGFIIESLAYAYSHGYESEKLSLSLSKAWDYYINNLFTDDNFPKYFNTSTKYPIESQNCAQAIQTLTLVSTWLGWNKKDLLDKLINNTINNLFDDKGFFYYKKTKLFTYKQSYLRWSTSPMLVALSYADKYYKQM